MHEHPRAGRRDPPGRAIRCSQSSVEGEGELENQEGQTRGAMVDEGTVDPPSRLLEHASCHLEASSSHLCKSFAANALIRIFHGHDGAVDACLDHCRCTRRGFAEEVARFQRDVQARPGRIHPSKGEGLRVRGPRSAVRASSDDPAVSDEDGTDAWVGRRRWHRARQSKGLAHEVLINRGHPQAEGISLVS